MNKKIRPIIKWTGGKYDEFASFANQIPEFKRYIEPFFGGGGVFFALKPQGKSIINDKSTDLVNFYTQIGNEDFRKEIFKYADAWDQLGEISLALWVVNADTYFDYINGKIDHLELLKAFSQSLVQLFKLDYVINDESFIVDVALFNKILLASILDKAKRIKRICEKETRVFNHAELKDHFITGIKGGFYLFLRTILNQQYNKIINLSAAKAAANWYFVREFCYGSMFRFNAKGEFNIPYGGIAYNKKNFRLKAQNIFNDDTLNLFKQTTIYNLDFEAFFKSLTIKATDFIFLDPPYDSEFSEYDQSAFTQIDQERLANCIINLKAKWMMVIKETAFIKNLYTKPHVYITTFEKNYTYNVRGRNSRAATHLIITNYR